MGFAYAWQDIVYSSTIMKSTLIDERLVEHTVFGLGEEHPIQVMVQDPVPADSTVTFDMHYELEMGIVLEGTMIRYAGNSRRTCSAGDVWFCGMWEPHGYRGDAACRRAVIAIWPPALASLRFPEARHINWMQPFIISPERRPVIPDELRDEVTSLVNHHI